MIKLEQLETYIEQDPYKPGPAGARLKRSGVPIWALISYYKYAVHEDLDQTACDFELPREDVAAAVAYYQQHVKAIDARITTNSSAIA